MKFVSVGNFFWQHSLSANFCIYCTFYCFIFSNHFLLIWSQKALCYVKQRCVRAKICTFPMFGNKQVVLPLQSFYALLSQVSKIELYVWFVIFSPSKILWQTSCLTRTFKNISHLNWSPDVHKGADESLHTSHFVRQPTFDIDKDIFTKSCH